MLSGNGERSRDRTARSRMCFMKSKPFLSTITGAGNGVRVNRTGLNRRDQTKICTDKSLCSFKDLAHVEEGSVFEKPYYAAKIDSIAIPADCQFSMMENWQDTENSMHFLEGC